MLGRAWRDLFPDDRLKGTHSLFERDTGNFDIKVIQEGNEAVDRLEHPHLHVLAGCNKRSFIGAVRRDDPDAPCPKVVLVSLLG